MNRTIKFRGKCLHSDEWCFGSLVDYGDGEMEIQGFDVFLTDTRHTSSATFTTTPDC